MGNSYAKGGTSSGFLCLLDANPGQNEITILILTIAGIVLIVPEPQQRKEDTRPRITAYGLESEESHDCDLEAL